MYSRYYQDASASGPLAGKLCPLLNSLGIICASQEYKDADTILRLFSEAVTVVGSYQLSYSTIIIIATAVANSGSFQPCVATVSKTLK